MRREVLREIQILHHLANRALVRGPITEVLQSLTGSIASLLPADRVSIIGFNLEKESISYFLEGGKGRRHVVTEVSYGELWEGLSGWALRGDAPALSSKLVPDSRETPTVQARRRATNCGSILVVPVRNNEGPLATITAINLPEERDFTEEDVEVMTVFAISASVLIENAKLLADVQLSRDVAEAARAQLAEQNAMKDKLFTILAHDLRGPVGSLSVLLGTAGQTPLSADELREVLGEGHRSAEQTYSLLDNLLGWVRSQMDEVKVLRTRFQAAKSLVPVQMWMKPQAEAKGITLLMDCASDLTLETDERMLETIVRNLVSNAVKFSRENTSVIIRGRRRDESVVIEVEDHGEGIAPERLPALFHGRMVGSAPGTDGERGSGLGLMFCTDLAKALGGILEAESTVSAGSLFRLVLPDPLDGEL